jgi:hypothetical protein
VQSVSSSHLRTIDQHRSDTLSAPRSLGLRHPDRSCAPINTHLNGGGSVQLGSIRNPDPQPQPPEAPTSCDSLSGAFSSAGGFRIELLTLGRLLALLRRVSLPVLRPTFKALSALLSEACHRSRKVIDGGKEFGAGSGVRKERVELNRARCMGIQSAVLAWQVRDFAEFPRYATENGESAGPENRSLSPRNARRETGWA